MPASPFINSETRYQTRRTSRARRWIGAAILAVVLYVLYLVQTHRVEYFEITSGSMLPTLEVGKTYIMLPADQYLRGQIVVFPNPDEHETMLVKRLVAMEGDTVVLRGGQLYINGAVNDPPQGKMPPLDADDHTWHLVHGQVFVVGDNRPASHDSRDFGPILLADLHGILEDKPVGTTWWDKLTGLRLTSDK